MFKPSILLYGPCPTIQTQALAFLYLISKSAYLVGTSCPEATGFLRTECFLQHCVIPSVQSSAWHNEYLLNERVHKRWLLTAYFSPLSAPKVLLTGHILTVLDLVLGDGDACFFDVVYAPTWLIWWPARSSNEGRFSSPVLSYQRKA